MALIPHQSFDAAAAPSAAHGLQLDMDTRAAVASVCLAMDPLDVVDEPAVGGRARALRARAPGIVAGRRDTEHIAQDLHRIVGTAIFDEAESHFGAPAKIAIDFLRNSRFGLRRNGLQHEAQRFGAALKVGEDAGTVLLLIVVGPGSL
jgi:hypothetical protein